MDRVEEIARSPFGRTALEMMTLGDDPEFVAMYLEEAWNIYA